MMVVITLIALLALGFLITAGVVWLGCFLLGLIGVTVVFTWKLAFVVWALCALVKFLFGIGSSKQLTLPQKKGKIMLDIRRTIQHHITLTKEQQTFARDLIDLYFNSNTNFMDNQEDFFDFVEAIAEEEEFTRCGGEVLLDYTEEEEDE